MGGPDPAEVCRDRRAGAARTQADPRGDRSPGRPDRRRPCPVRGPREVRTGPLAGRTRRRPADRIRRPVAGRSRLRVAGRIRRPVAGPPGHHGRAGGGLPGDCRRTGHSVGPRRGHADAAASPATHHDRPAAPPLDRVGDPTVGRRQSTGARRHDLRRAASARPRRSRDHRRPVSGRGWPMVGRDDRHPDRMGRHRDPLNRPRRIRGRSRTRVEDRDLDRPAAGGRRNRGRTPGADRRCPADRRSHARRLRVGHRGWPAWMARPRVDLPLPAFGPRACPASVVRLGHRDAVDQPRVTSSWRRQR